MMGCNMTAPAMEISVRRNGISRDALISGFLCALLCMAAHGQGALNRDEARLAADTEGTLLQVDSARPLARAAMTLETRYGYVITYEDPRYSNEDDLVDAGSTVRKNYSTSRPAAEQRL